MAADVKTWLVEQGHRSVFLDFDPEAGIPAGRSWEQELYQQLRACRAVIVLCSEHSMSSRWCFVEITHARSLGKPVFPLKIEDCEVDPVLTDRQIIDLTANRAQAFERLGRGLTLAGIDAQNPFDWDGSRPPYPGLLCFGEEDAAVFFGRDPEIGAGLDQLTQMRRYGGTGLLLLLGASGSGKSSLMRAGMVPRLRRDPEQWLVVDPFRPGSKPLVNLAGALARAYETSGRRRDWKEIRDELASSTEQTYAGASLIRDLRLGSKHKEATMVLFIDQFEELLGYPLNHPASRFLVDLRTALDPPRGHYLTVATLRSDFLATFQKHPLLAGVPFRSLSLGPMPVESLTEIIERPATLAGIDMEPPLVQALLKDTESEDALPLLAFTLRELWELSKDDRRLGVEKYRDQLGGLKGSVARAADTVLASGPLSEDEEEDLRGAFLGMVRLDEEGHFARRAAAWNRLPAGAHAWLERFVQARLLVAGGGDQERTVEVAHEALFRAWDKLASWLDENREALLLRQELGQAVRLWDQGGRAEEDLWRGGRLDRALQLRDRSFDRRLEARRGEAAGGRLPMAEGELEFLATAEKVEHRRQRRRRLRRRVVVAASLLVAAVTSVLFVLAREARYEARTQALAAQARGLQQKQLDLALLLSLEVDRRGSALEARRLLYEGLESSPRLETLLHRHRADVRAVAWSPDGRLLASGSGAEPNLLVWDVASEEPAARPLAGTAAEVWSLAFSPDGRLLAAGAEGGVLLWDVYAPPAEPRRLVAEARPASQVFAVAWSPDGRLLAAARADHDVEVWDVAAGAPAGEPFAGATDQLRAVAWSPDGTTLTAGGMDKKVRRWDAATGERLAPLRPDHGQGVMSLDYSPDGALLASGSLDGSVNLWDTSTGDRSGPPLDSLIGAVASVAWAGDSRTLAVGGTGGRVAFWDVDQRRLMAPTADGQIGALLSVAWSPDARRVASGNGAVVALWRADGEPRLGRQVILGATEVRSFALSPDGATMAAVGRDPIRQDLGIRLWDAGTGEHRGVMQGTERRPPELAWSADSRSLSSAGLDRKVRLWEVSTGRALAELDAGDRNGARPSSMAWDDGATRLAIGGRDGAVALWSADGTVPLVAPTGAGESRITVLEWGVDGSRLAAGAYDGGIRVWSPVSGSERGVLLAGHDGAVTSLAWSPNGATLASAGRDLTVRLWDVEAGEQDGAPLTGFVDFATRLAWSPDGDSLAVATNKDWRVQLFDAERRELVAGPFAGHADTISGLWWSAGGKTLTSVSVDGTLRHWDVDPASWRERVCRVANRDLTPEEWQRYLPDSRYRGVCDPQPDRSGATR